MATPHFPALSQQGLEIAGLRRELPVESEREDDAEKDGLVRKNVAHDRSRFSVITPGP